MVFEEKNEPFPLKNVSNITHEFLYENFDAFSRRNGSFFSFNLIIKKIFWLKMSYKNLFVNFDAFSRQICSFIFLQNEDAQNKKMSTLHFICPYVHKKNSPPKY